MKKKLYLISGIFLTGLIIYNLIPESKIPLNTTIDKIIIIKSKHQLLAFSSDSIIKIYKVSIGRNLDGPKEIEGDNKTPEGDYLINDKTINSSFHKNLGISYPNAYDIARANTLSKDPGGEIKIHGLKNSLGFVGKFHRLIDWTAGCIAMTNREIDDLYLHTPIGTPIVIKK